MQLLRGHWLLPDTILAMRVMYALLYNVLVPIIIFVVAIEAQT